MISSLGISAFSFSYFLFEPIAYFVNYVGSKSRNTIPVYYLFGRQVGSDIESQDNRFFEA